MARYRILALVRATPVEERDLKVVYAYADKITKEQLQIWQEKLRTKYCDSFIISWQEIEEEEQINEI